MAGLIKKHFRLTWKCFRNKFMATMFIIALRGLKKIKKFFSPKSPDEDLRRRELILNLLLIFSAGAFFFLNIIRLIDLITHVEDRGLPLFYTLLIFFFFLFLFWLGKSGRIRLASWGLILAYAAPLSYCFIVWGADLPAALLLTVLLITLCGILLGAAAVLYSTLIINIGLVILSYSQEHGLIKYNSYWHAEKHEVGDALAYAVLFMIIAAIVWLFSREIKKTLKRARTSEAELKQERDLLEIRVIQKTAALRQVEAEKINQLYRFAEFGRLSSGIFHDLINPLTAVSLNLEQISEEDLKKISAAKAYVQQAMLATKRMEALIASIKKQIQKDNQEKIFSVSEEIQQILEILEYKARQAQAMIKLEVLQELKIFGSPLKFGQSLSNLLANAIEACENSPKKEILISVRQQAGKGEIIVKDSGTGILPENLEKIWQPFFSTKKENGRGLGIGLSSTKETIEKDFVGKISVNSILGEGSEFSIRLPLCD